MEAGTNTNEKITPSRADVDALVAAGLLGAAGFLRLEHLGGTLAATVTDRERLNA